MKMAWYFVSIVVFCFVQIERIRGQVGFEPLYPPIQMPENIPLALDNYMPGDTFLLGAINPTYIVSSGWTDMNQYQIVFNDQANVLFNEQMIVGALEQMQYIDQICLSFHDSQNNLLRDANGDDLEYVGSPDDIGHVFRAIPKNLLYSFIKFFILPKTDQRFDPARLYFHWGHTGPPGPPRPPGPPGLPGPPAPRSGDENDESLDVEDDRKVLEKIENDSDAIDRLINRTMNESLGSKKLENLDCRLRNQIHIRRSSSTEETETCSTGSSEESENGLDHAEYTISMMQGVWDTTAGSDCTRATPGLGKGKYLPRAPPVAAFDTTANTKYLAFGVCGSNPAASLKHCGLKTGFYFSFKHCSTKFKSFKIRTANNALLRDPINITIEGSNKKLHKLCQGESWNLLYEGTSGLSGQIRRQQWGKKQIMTDIDKTYKSYRFLVTRKRGLSIGVQYADIEFEFQGCKKWRKNKEHVSGRESDHEQVESSGWDSSSYGDDGPSGEGEDDDARGRAFPSDEEEVRRQADFARRIDEARMREAGRKREGQGRKNHDDDEPRGLIGKGLKGAKQLFGRINPLGNGNQQRSKN